MPHPNRKRGFRLEVAVVIRTGSFPYTSISMRDKHPLAGQTLRVACSSCDAEKVFTVDDWFENAMGISWKDCPNNPACLNYALRANHFGIPLDEDVVYGKLPAGEIHLVHNLELLRALYPDRESPSPEPESKGSSKVDDVNAVLLTDSTGVVGIGVSALGADGIVRNILALSFPCAKALAYGLLQACYKAEGMGFRSKPDANGLHE